MPSEDTTSARDLWDSIGKPYQVAFENVPAQQRSLHWLIEHLPKGAKCLDIGCGTGQPVCKMLADAGMDVVGVDIAPSMITASREQVPNANFILADSLTWQPQTGDASADAVVAYFSFISGVTQDDIKSFFERAFRWLKPGGVFVFGTVPVFGERMVIKWMGRDAVCSGLDVDRNLQAMRHAGFEVLKHEVEKLMPKGVEAGLCKAEDVWEEEHLFVYAKKL